MLSQTTGQHIVACRLGTTRGCSTKVHVRYTPYLFILRTQSIPAPSISAIDGVVAGTFASRYAMSAYHFNACGTEDVASHLVGCITRRRTTWNDTHAEGCGKRPGNESSISGGLFGRPQCVLPPLAGITAPHTGRNLAQSTPSGSKRGRVS